jgi:hypothetical protein
MEVKPVLKSKLIVPLLIIAIAALISVYYFMGTDYLRQRRGHEVLTTQVTETAQTLARTPPPPQDLESQMAAAEASLAAAQSALPGDINSTRAINAILQLADAWQVRAIPLVTDPWTKGNAGLDYRVFRLNIAVSGSFWQLNNFLSHLENGELETLVVEKVKVTRDTGGPTEADTPVQASIDLAIYSR